MFAGQRPLARAALACVLAAGCGSLSDPGNEPRGTASLPSAAVAPWEKVDLDGDPANLTQPHVLVARRLVERLHEPSALVDPSDGSIELYYERRAADGPQASIFRTRAARAEELLAAGPGLRVLAAELPWEGGRVGAPSVLEEPQRVPRFTMAYAGGDGSGIGLARSEDGERFTRAPDPVLVPDRAWEGGRIDAPSLLRVGEELWLWYAGGDGDGIGLARSADGRAWIKESAPVLLPEQGWEGDDLVPLARGHVGSPSVVREADGEGLFRLYYSGFLPVDRNPLVRVPVAGTSPGAINASVGFAASRDGVRWSRASAAVNPVLAEELPLTIGDLPFPAAILDGLGPVERALLVGIVGADDAGRPRVPAFETIVDEAEPQVLLLGPSRALMCFVQTESVFVPLAPALPETPITTPSGVLLEAYRTGIAIATIG